MRYNDFFLFIVIFVSTDALANDSCWNPESVSDEMLREAKLIETSPAEAARTLAQTFREVGEAETKKLVEETPALKGSLGLINIPDGGEGAWNLGVFLVKTDNGTLQALKIVETQKRDFRLDKTIRNNLMIQKILGDLRLAPKLKGVYSKEAGNLATVEKAIAESPFRPQKEVQYALLHEFIPDSVNFPKSVRAKEVISHWDKKTLKESLQRMVEIEKKLKELKINPRDLQFFIRDGGEVILGDLDHYHFVSHENGVQDLTQAMSNMVDIWEQANVERFSPAEFETLVGKKRLDYRDWTLWPH